MACVFSHENIMVVYNMKNLLEHAGIACQLRNDFSASAAGEVPPIEVWSEVHVSESDSLKALQLVDEALKGEASATTWLCPNCGETNEPAFELCWQCGTERSN